MQNDEAHVRFGKKRTYQMGVRLSDAEEATYQSVRRHWNMNDREWFEFAMQFVTQEAARNTAALVEAYKLWTPPSPAPHFHNCRVFETVAGIFLTEVVRVLTAAGVIRHPLDVKITPLIRWALQHASAHVLSRPSIKTQQEENELKVQRVHGRRPGAGVVLPDVQVPAGSSGFVPGFDPHRPAQGTQVVTPEPANGASLVQALTSALERTKTPVSTPLFLPPPSAPRAPLVLPPLPQQAVQALATAETPFLNEDINVVPSFYKSAGDPVAAPMPDFGDEDE